EQKLHDVVNSCTSASFTSLAAAFTAVQSSSPPTARPAPPPTVSLRTSLRLTRASLGSLMALSPCRAVTADSYDWGRLLQALHEGDERVDVRGRELAVLGRHRRLLRRVRLLGRVGRVRDPQPDLVSRQLRADAVERTRLAALAGNRMAHAALLRRV